jgi:hypothetical protein
MWTSLHTRLAAETQLANGEVQVSKDEFLKLRGIARIPKYSKMDKGAKDKLARSHGENGGG